MEEQKIRILSREEVLAIDDLPVEIVPVPEWGEGVGVKVRGMSFEQRAEYVRKSQGEDGQIDAEKAGYQAILIGVVEPKFDEADIPALAKKSTAALDRISKVWLRLSGIGEEELLKARGNS